jgi:hypothetical protein
MQPRRADDEFAPDDDMPGGSAGVSEDALADLPPAAKQSAESGRKELQAGNELMHAGLAMLRGEKRAESLDEPDRKLASARRHFESARDHFREALAFAPDHFALLELMQETKTNLYTCAKHGRSR